MLIPLVACGFILSYTDYDHLYEVREIKFHGSSC